MLIAFNRDLAIVNHFAPVHKAKCKIFLKMSSGLDVHRVRQDLAAEDLVDAGWGIAAENDECALPGWVAFLCIEAGTEIDGLAAGDIEGMCEFDLLADLLQAEA